MSAVSSSSQRLEILQNVAEEPLLAAGTRLQDRYRIEAVVGQGGCGTIYRAEHLELGRAVAIKVPHAELDEHAQITARFRRELRISARVKHAHLLEVHDAGVLDDRRPFLVMELLEGVTLHERLEGGPLPEADALRIMDELLMALEALASARIVHRDIKPSNVMLCRAREGAPEHVKLIDFGIARTIEDDGKLTLLGTVVGTLDYMAPEQLAGTPVDERADIYACGVILFEMLTGKNPHLGAGYEDRLRQALRATPKRLRLEGAHGPALSELVLRALATPRSERFASAAEMRAALSRVQAPRSGSMPLLTRWRRQPRVPLVAAALLVLGSALPLRGLLGGAPAIPLVHATDEAQSVDQAELGVAAPEQMAPLLAAVQAPSASTEEDAPSAPNVDDIEPAAAGESAPVAPVYASRAHARALRALAVGDYVRASAELDLALQRQPNHPGALRARVVLALAKHERGAAERALASYARHHPSAPDLAELRTWLLTSSAH